MTKVVDPKFGPYVPLDDGDGKASIHIAGQAAVLETSTGKSAVTGQETFTSQATVTGKVFLTGKAASTCKGISKHLQPTIKGNPNTFVPKVFIYAQRGTNYLDPKE